MKGVSWAGLGGVSGSELVSELVRAWVGGCAGRAMCVPAVVVVAVVAVAAAAAAGVVVVVVVVAG